MKNVFIKSTIILMTGTLLTKILGFVIKIIFTRLIKDGINIFALVMPTYSLLIAITQLGLPYAISAVMARGKVRGIKLFASITPIALLLNILVITLIFLFAPFLANNLLKNPDTYLPIVSISFVIPFTTISGILKGYYFGKQNMLPNSISNIFEQLTRLILLVIFIPILLKKSIVYAICGYIIICAICELVQIIIYLFFAPKNLKITKEDLKMNTHAIKEVFSLSIPSVGKNIIGNIAYFLEPIILTNILLFVGYSNGFILSEYGIYNAYVIPILTMPSFITLALNTTLIPEISKHHNDHKYVKRRMIQCLFFSFLIGLIFCIFIYFNGSLILSLIYDTDKGLDYLKFLCLFFSLFYLEGPLVSTLQGLNMSTYCMIITLISSCIKVICVIILSLFSIGIYGLLISEIINIVIVIYLSFKKLHQKSYI